MGVATMDEVSVMAWIVFVIATLLLISAIPSDIWSALFKIAWVLLLGSIAWLALIVALTS